MESSAKKILLIYNNYSTFVERDYEILSESNLVHRYQFKSSKKFYKLSLVFLKQFFFLLFKGWRYDVFFIWFADYHSFLPVRCAKITQKESYIVIGGYDVARVKKYVYGVFVKRNRGWFAIQSIKNCTCNIAISQYVNRKIRFIAPSAKRQLIYNAVDQNLLKRIVDKPKERLVLTVAIVDSEQTFYIKGLDRFIECAQKIPHVPFVIVGLDKEKLSNLLLDIPKNLYVYKKVAHQELQRYYQRAQVYCQLSRSESFSLALAEAISYGCTPVITNVGGMPEIVEDKRFIQGKESLDQLVLKVLENKFKYERFDFVKSKFSLEERKRLVLQLIS